MPTARIGAQTIAYEDTGGHGPAILFSHSFGMNGTMFAPQLARFGATHRCITWDERAHGGSPASAPFTYWDSARDALGLLDHLGIARAFFVGTSQGGFLSLRAALLAPERIAAMAILGSSAAGEPAERRPSYLALRQSFVEAGPAGPPEQTIQTISHISLGGYAGVRHWEDQWRAWPAAQFALAFDALLDRDDITARLGEITVPTLVMHGESDNSFAPSCGEAIASGVAASLGFVLVPGGAHFLSLTDPDIVNAHLGRMVGG